MRYKNLKLQVYTDVKEKKILSNLQVYIRAFFTVIEIFFVAHTVSKNMWNKARVINDTND